MAGLKPPAISAAIVPALTTALASRDRDVRSLVVSLLVRIGRENGAVIQALIKMLEEPIDPRPANPQADDPLRAAWQGLGELAPATPWADETIAALTDFVRRGHPGRASAAAGALGRFGQDAAAAVPALIERLRETTSAPVSYSDGESSVWSLGESPRERRRLTKPSPPSRRPSNQIRSTHAPPR